MTKSWVTQCSTPGGRMTSQLWKGQAFSVSHADGAGTVRGGVSGGLRAFFEYRDFGCKQCHKKQLWGEFHLRSGWSKRRAHVACT